ncbi:hypothetical protein GCM10007939_07910 [Amylibacter marinus]|uniref:Lipoprotein n=1 Tax=Amylibacter marinus TaxID=1475483 RepID=A0ABQ5VSV3_9RHOB|nr:hypothetical protein [Amylibacter marinus]GLQ34508.1 hypothetical protein GCM10007939_07910 [Amylibacter marinus]
MQYVKIISSGILALAACAPKDQIQSIPTMSLTDAMQMCRAQIESASKPKTEFGLGVEVGSNGHVRPRSDLSLTVDISSPKQKDKRYVRCVQQNAGLDPTDSYSAL